MEILFTKLQSLLNQAKNADFVALLALRLYLFPVLWMAGFNKFDNFSATVDWFGNAEWGLDLPFPALLVVLVTLTELLGAICLLLGLAVRIICIPLFFTMIGAALTVHWENGWLAIASGQGLFANDRTIGAIERLDKAKDILQQYGHYQWLTENGSFVVLNNGVEFAVTYACMILVLFFYGAGRYVSLDYWLNELKVFK